MANNDPLGEVYRGTEGSGLAQILPQNNVGIDLLKQRGDTLMKMAMSKVKADKDKGKDLDWNKYSLNMAQDWDKDHLEWIDKNLTEYQAKIAKAKMESQGKEPDVMVDFELRKDRDLFQTRLNAMAKIKADKDTAIQKILTDKDISKEQSFEKLNNLFKKSKADPTSLDIWGNIADWAVYKPKDWVKSYQEDKLGTDMSSWVNEQTNRYGTNLNKDAINKKIDDLWNVHMQTQEGMDDVYRFAMEDRKFNEELTKEGITKTEFLKLGTDNPQAQPDLQKWVDTKKDELKDIYNKAMWAKISDKPFIRVISGSGSGANTVTIEPTAIPATATPPSGDKSDMKYFEGGTRYPLWQASITVINPRDGKEYFITDKVYTKGGVHPILLGLPVEQVDAYRHKILGNEITPDAYNQLDDKERESYDPKITPTTYKDRKPTMLPYEDNASAVETSLKKKKFKLADYKYKSGATQKQDESKNKQKVDNKETKKVVGFNYK